VSFRPNQEFDPIEWTGDIATPKPEPKKDGKNREGDGAKEGDAKAGGKNGR
jgi:hypothetical protein